MTLTYDQLDYRDTVVARRKRNPNVCPYCASHVDECKRMQQGYHLNQCLMWEAWMDQ